MIGGFDCVIPDVVDPIIGYRAWITEPALPLAVLMSTTNLTPWPADGPLHAKCVCWFGNGCGDTPSRPESRAEHGGSGCGIYAYGSFDNLYDHLHEIAVSPIIGQVALSGRVFTHDIGYRAERARVVALYANGHPDVKRIADDYGVPLLPMPASAFKTTPAERAFDAAVVALAAIGEAGLKVYDRAAQAVTKWRNSRRGNR